MGNGFDISTTFFNFSFDLVILYTLITLTNLHFGKTYIFINPSNEYDKNKFNLGL